jgi:hypothetical protein
LGTPPNCSGVKLAPECLSGLRMATRNRGEIFGTEHDREFWYH